MAWIAAAAAAAALVWYLARVLPMNMDEVLSYQQIACLLQPFNRADPLANGCSSLDLAVVAGRHWPLRSFEHQEPAE